MAPRLLDRHLCIGCCLYNPFPDRVDDFRYQLLYMPEVTELRVEMDAPASLCDAKVDLSLSFNA